MDKASKLNLSMSNLITKAARVVVHHYQRELTPYGISPSQGGILYILSIVGGSTQVEIAKLLHLEKTNVNAMIKKLESAKLVQVNKISDDARKTEVSLTKKGQDLAVKLVEADKKVTRLIMQKNENAKDAEIIKKFLERIVFE